MTEKQAVSAAIKNIDGLFSALMGKKQARAGTKEILQDLASRIDVFARAEGVEAEDLTAMHLVRANARSVGLRNVSLWIAIDLREALMARFEELKDQETEFWTVTNRPPNYFARTIALRTARKYARAKGEYPTLGTSRDSGEPSTAYARCLKEVFRILKIEAAIRGPAEWAISQLSDEDIKPPQGLLGNALAWNPQMPTEDGVMNALLEAMAPAKKGGTG